MRRVTVLIPSMRSPDQEGPEKEIFVTILGVC